MDFGPKRRLRDTDEGWGFRYEVSDGVALLTFDRPQVLNALTFEVYAQFRDLLEDLRYDDAVKVLVLTGSGDAFCSGGDVQAMFETAVVQDQRTGALATRAVSDVEAIEVGFARAR